MGVQVVDGMNDPEKSGIAQSMNFSSRNRVFALNDQLCHENPDSQRLARSRGGSSKLEIFSSRGESRDGVVGQISSRGDTTDGVDGPKPAGSSPNLDENEAEIGRKCLEIGSAMPSAFELHGKETKYFGEKQPKNLSN